MEEFQIPDRLHGIEGDFGYRRCTGCASWFQSPRVIEQDLALCYPDRYYTHGGATAITSRPNIFRAAVRQRIMDSVQGRSRSLLGAVLSSAGLLRSRAFWGLLDEMIPRVPAPGRALDVGCGAGDLLKALRQVGWDAEGVERDPAAAEVAHSRSGAMVHAGDLHRLPFTGRVFELVVLNHVFEHVDAPKEALMLLAQLLAQDGRLVLVMPNARSVGCRAFGRNWFSWDPPRHLLFPSAEALRRMAAHTGLRVLSIRSVARDATVTSARSRQYRRTATADAVRIRAVDRLFAACERLLVAAGALVGEEIVVTFERG